MTLIKTRLLFSVVGVLTVLFVLSGCATQIPYQTFSDVPAFFSGFWHGFIALFSLIGSLFDSSIKVYAFPNSGWWYDFGFLIGIGAFSRVEVTVKKK